MNLGSVFIHEPSLSLYTAEACPSVRVSNILSTNQLRSMSHSDDPAAL